MLPKGRVGGLNRPCADISKAVIPCISDSEVTVARSQGTTDPACFSSSGTGDQVGGHHRSRFVILQVIWKREGLLNLPCRAV